MSPFVRQLAVAVFLYLLTVSYVSANGWGTGELLWALWISSFSLGYLTIILTCLQLPAAAFAKAIEDKSQRKLAALVGIGAMIPALFMLAFFTVHFGMFHTVHGIFLQEFFPLPEALAPAGNDIPDIINVLPAIFVAFLPFIVICAINQYDDFISLFTAEKKDLGFARPYINVVRMHVTIIAIAFASAMGIENFGLYFVLVVYFLPLVGIFRAILARIRAARPARSSAGNSDDEST